MKKKLTNKKSVINLQKVFLSFWEMCCWRIVEKFSSAKRNLFVIYLTAHEILFLEMSKFRRDGESLVGRVNK